MKTSLTSALTLLMMTVSSFLSLSVSVAQDTGSNPEVREELNHEIDSLYPKVRESHGSQAAETPKAIRVKKETIVEPTASNNNNKSNQKSKVAVRSNSNSNSSNSKVAQASATTASARPTFNQPTQTQPTTVVEDTPLKESRANAIRKQRLQVEQGTEEKIVEHLEDDRIKAEQERSNRVLKSLNKNSNKSANSVKPEVVLVPAQKAEVTPAAPAVVEPVAAPVTAATVENTSDAKVDLDKEEKAPEEKSRFFVGALAGVGNYPSLQNVRGIYAAGLSAGMIFPERLVLEGTFLYSSYDVQNVVTTYVTPIPTITEMTTTSIMAALKYQILKSRVTPVVGALVSYDYRTFKDRQYYYSSQTSNSQAFDAGLSGGVDVNLNPTFTVGMDFKYMFNLTYRRDQALDPGFAYSGTQPGTPIEAASYYVLSVSGKVNF